MKEILQGQRRWQAEDTSQRGLMLFALQMLAPLKAMEEARIIRIETTSQCLNGRFWETEVRIIEIAPWVLELDQRP